MENFGEITILEKLQFWRNYNFGEIYLFQEHETAQKLGFWGQHQTHLEDINKHLHSIISYTAN